jgi:hypothetical protein
MTLNDPVILFILIIGGLFIALELYLGYLRFTAWLERKIRLFRLSFKMIFSKEKEIRAVGWATFKLILWESEDNDKT